MAAKIVCGNCNTSLLYNVAKDMKICPVCGENIWNCEENEGAGNNNVQEESEDSLMYFDEIMIFKDEPEYNNVRVYCGECGESNIQETNKFDKLVDKEYVILKEGITLTCRGCGKEHRPRKILYKRKDNYAPPLPRCPACNSVMLKKIATGSKVLAAATLGAFALPYNSKTFECRNCGYRF